MQSSGTNELANELMPNSYFHYSWVKIFQPEEKNK